jgi:hypothetical protein
MIRIPSDRSADHVRYKSIAAGEVRHPSIPAAIALDAARSDDKLLILLTDKQRTVDMQENGMS